LLTQACHPSYEINHNKHVHAGYGIMFDLMVLVFLFPLDFCAKSVLFPKNLSAYRFYSPVKDIPESFKFRPFSLFGF
jgi:hypothetical protein